MELDIVSVLTIGAQVLAAAATVLFAIREFRKVQSQTVKDYAESRRADASVISTYSETIIRLEERIRRIEKEKDERSASQEMLEEELDLTRDSLAEAMRQVIEAQATMAQYLTELQTLRDENLRLQKRIDALEAELANYKQRLRKTEDEIDSGVHRR